MTQESGQVICIGPGPDALLMRALRREVMTDDHKESSSSGPSPTEKGAVNVAVIGTAACNSRAASTAHANGECCPVEAVGYHRCHGDSTRVIALDGEAGAGTLCMEVQLVSDESVARARLFASDDWVRPTWACGATYPGLSCRPRCQRHSRPPKAPRVVTFNVGTSIRAPRYRSAASCPSPATSRTRGGASVVVRARESRVHGEGRQ